MVSSVGARIGYLAVLLEKVSFSDTAKTATAQANNTVTTLIAKLASRWSASVFLSCVASSLMGRGNGRMDTPPYASRDHQQRTSWQGKTHPPNGTSSGAPMRERFPRTHGIRSSENSPSR